MTQASPEDLEIYVRIPWKDKIDQTKQEVLETPEIPPAYNLAANYVDLSYRWRNFVTISSELAKYAEIT